MLGTFGLHIGYLNYADKRRGIPKHRNKISHNHMSLNQSRSNVNHEAFVGEDWVCFANGFTVAFQNGPSSTTSQKKMLKKHLLLYTRISVETSHYQHMRFGQHILPQ